MKFLQEGLSLIQNLQSKSSASVPRIDLDLSERKALENSSIDEDLNSSLVNPENYIILPDHTPRSEKHATDYRNNNQDLEEKGIRALINDINQDIHASSSLSELYYAMKSVDIDAEDCISTLAFKPYHLVLCGVGNGLAVSQLINYLKPSKISILISSWEDLACSFNVINWLEIWNEYCLDDLKSIKVIFSEFPESAANNFVHACYLSLDHAFMYKSPVANQETSKIYDLLKTDIVRKTLGYLGFAMDEYNMLWNSWRALKKKPRIYSKFSTKLKQSGTYIVCGSGPSLDVLLPWIKEHQHEAIIISCASNYGTLRKYGIEVDVLCLLERGEFMFEQYNEVANICGTGNTKLLASATTPPDIQDLFKYPMIYFRPALTPTALFSDNASQVLNLEGPQTVNTGVSFAISQQPKQIILCGVDLGAKSVSKVRSTNAVGHTPRHFDITYPGNLEEKVLTDHMLLDSVVILDVIGKANDKKERDKISFINLSDGVKLEGWHPADKKSIVFNMEDVEEKDRLSDWWKSRQVYSTDRFRAHLKSSRIRERVFESLNKIKQLTISVDPEGWNTFKDSLELLLNAHGVPSKDQVVIRVIRGSFARIILGIDRQIIILAKKSPNESYRFLEAAKPVLLSSLDRYQNEIFALFDMIEEEALL